MAEVKEVNTVWECIKNVFKKVSEEKAVEKVEKKVVDEKEIVSECYHVLVDMCKYENKSGASHLDIRRSWIAKHRKGFLCFAIHDLLISRYQKVMDSKA